MIQFSVDRVEAHATMKRMKAALSLHKVNINKAYCELKVTKTKLTLVAPCSLLSIPCSATGSATVTLPFKEFYNLIKLENKATIEINLLPASVMIGNFEFRAQPVFFPGDEILRIIRLPAKYNLKDLVTILRGGYNQEELEINNIPKKIAEADRLGCSRFFGELWCGEISGKWP